MLKEMVKDVTTFFVFFLKIENLLNKYDELAHKIYFWTPEVQRSAAETAKNPFWEYQSSILSGSHHDHN